MTLPFFKMNGLGNDFVVIDARHGSAAPSPAQIEKLANRRFGVGFDQLIVMEPGKGEATFSCASSMAMAARRKPAAMPLAAWAR